MFAIRGAIYAIATVAFAAPAGAVAATPAVPRLLSQTGLYAGSCTGPIAAHNLAFSPQYPLWSDGAHKARWVYLPRGKQIGTRNPGAWEFPAGTKFWKEFVFDGRRVETRFLWKTGDNDWVAATYVWRPDQSDADLAPEDGIADFVEIAPGKRHSIPGLADCRACHESRSFAPLGFNAVQLSTDRDPNALHAEPLAPGMATLQTLSEQQRFAPARPEWLQSPPRIAAATPRTRSVLGYFTVNCGSCHNPENLGSLGLFLRHPTGAQDDPQGALRTAAGVPSRYAIPGAPAGSTFRIAPGAPEHSAIAFRMASRRPISQMPPFGSVLVDSAAVELVRRWIAADLAPQPGEHSRHNRVETPDSKVQRDARACEAGAPMVKSDSSPAVSTVQPPSVRGAGSPCASCGSCGARWYGRALWCSWDPRLRSPRFAPVRLRGPSPRAHPPLPPAT